MFNPTFKNMTAFEAHNGHLFENPLIIDEQRAIFSCRSASACEPECEPYLNTNTGTAHQEATDKQQQPNVTTLPARKTAEKPPKSEVIPAKQKKLQTGEKKKSHQCTICEKNLSNSYALKKHMQKHTRVKTYVCPLCTTYFTKKTSLKKHLKIH